MLKSIVVLMLVAVAGDAWAVCSPLERYFVPVAADEAKSGYVSEMWDGCPAAIPPGHPLDPS